MTIAITNKGGGTLTVSSLAALSGPFTLVSPPATPFNVPAAGIPITVRFTPTTAGAQKATLTIGSNDPNNASLPVSLTGTGVAPTGGVHTTQLVVDDGTFESLAGFPNGSATAYFVNRLTPPSYPATLRSVEIAFFDVPNGLKKGDALNILTAANPSGSINLNGIPLAATATTVAGVDQFNSFTVTPITIQSGDFVVGFSAPNPANFYLMAVDTSSGSKQRSYLSTDGSTFTPIDFYPDLAGNFGIRATVDVGGSTVTGPKIATTAASVDFTSVPPGQPKDITLTITNSGGGTLSVSSLLPPPSAPFSIVSAPATPFNVPAAGVPITVRFSPTATGAQSGTLTIVSNDSSGDPARSTLKIPLTGTGTSTGGGGSTGSLDTSNPLSTNLVGLFAMNEGSGATDKNLADGQLANFSGANPPTWNASDPSIVFKGGASLNSYLNAGTDPVFDKLPVSQMTIVARVFANNVTAAGICEKNDGNSADGFVFGPNGTGGGLQLTVEMSDRNMRVESVGAITAGKWIQVAATWDGTKGTGNAADAHLFANGVELTKVVNNSGSGTLGYAGATNQPFRIGTAAFDFPGSFDGKMQYLAVYKGRILTPAEMKQLDAKLPVK
jgi:hypothetical protein